MKANGLKESILNVMPDIIRKHMNSYLFKYGNRTLLQTYVYIRMYSEVTLHKKSQSFLRIWSHLLEKSLIENFIFCTVRVS